MWRFSGQFPKFFHVDARIVIIILVFLVHISVLTFVIMVLSGVALGLMAWKGLTIPNAFRAIRAWLASDFRPGIPLHKRRRSFIRRT